MWDGRRILPEGWVRYTTTATPQSPRRDFGAHLWVKVPEPFNSHVSPPVTAARRVPRLRTRRPVCQRDSEPAAGHRAPRPHVLNLRGISRITGARIAALPLEYCQRAPGGDS